MPPRALTSAHGRRFGFFGRSIAALLGVALVSAACAVIFLHGWMGVIEGLPAMLLGGSALYLAAVGREPGWWRSS